VLLSPGGLNTLTEDELIERTRAVAAVMPIIGFYLQQAVGGRVFSFRYWEKICEIDHVIGIKCASFNRYTTIDVVRAVAFSERSEAITLYTGNDDNIVIDLLTPYRFAVNGKTVMKRFQGGLLGHWSVCTYSVVRLFQKLKEAARQEAIPSELLTLAAEITDANAAIFDAAHGFKGCIAGIHEVLRRQGLLDGIWCLNEEETLSHGQQEEIDRVFDLYPHLRDTP
jgi:dihydrodipicolinate synthase/N-acetylneuraminate lyase